MDIKAKFKENKRQIFLLSVVTLISLVANLPDKMLADLVDQKLLLIVLATVIVIALFYYLNLLLFLCVVALAIGANLPDHMAETLGVSPIVMLTFLVLLVVISQMNAVFKKFEAVKVEKKHDSEESRKAVLAAVSKGDLTKLHWLLNANVEINFAEDGITPLILAAEKGYTDVIQSLISYGVDLSVMNPAGQTAMEIALANGFNRTAEIMKLATAGDKLGWSK